jgi:hypothetical protein
MNTQQIIPDFRAPFAPAPKLRSSLPPEVFGSLTALVEPLSDQVQKLIYRHSGGLSFGRVKISENLGPGSDSGAFSSVQLILEPFPHTYRISTARADPLVSNSTFPQNNGRNLLISILHLLNSWTPELLNLPQSSAMNSSLCRSMNSVSADRTASLRRVP